MTKEEYLQKQKDINNQISSLESSLIGLFFEYAESMTGLEDGTLLEINGDLVRLFHIESYSNERFIIELTDESSEIIIQKLTLEEFLKLNYTIINED